MAGPSIAVGTRDDGQAEVTLTGLRKMPGWTFRALLRVHEDRQPEVRSLAAEPPEGTALTPEAFRRIPSGEVIRLAESAFRSPLIALVAERVGAEVGPRPYGGSADHHRAVATLYRTALTQGLPPKETVAETYGVSIKTASRWAADCRRETDATTGQRFLRSYAEEVAEYGIPKHVRAYERQVAERRSTQQTKQPTHKQGRTQRTTKKKEN